MFATRTLHLHWELIKWLAIVTLAAALAAGMATRIAGAAEPVAAARPATLPDKIEAWAKPMDVPVAAPLTYGVENKDVDLGTALWRVLDYHRAVKPNDALAGWATLTLPPGAEIWRHLGMAQAYLTLGETEGAANELAAARDLGPENAVVRYYLGVLRLMQARTANDWYDAVGPTKIRLAAYGPMDVAPNTRGMYRLAAKNELERAVEMIDYLPLTHLLVPPTWAGCETLTPTVHDFLVALGVDPLGPRAHNMLTYLYLEDEALAEAEHHLDAAIAGGMANPFGYRDLAKRYEARGWHLDAARANLKALARTRETAPRWGAVLGNFRDAVIDNWR